MFALEACVANGAILRRVDRWRHWRRAERRPSSGRHVANSRRHDGLRSSREFTPLAGRKRPYETTAQGGVRQDCEASQRKQRHQDECHRHEAR